MNLFTEPKAKNSTAYTKQCWSQVSSGLHNPYAWNSVDLPGVGLGELSGHYRVTCAGSTANTDNALLIFYYKISIDFVLVQTLTFV